MSDLLDRLQKHNSLSTSLAVERPALGRWIDRPAGWPVVLILVGLTLAAPFWLLADEVTYFIISGDDFAYIAESRTWPITFANLMTPHNTHIVPLFRLWTAILVTLAGRLANLPTVIGVASYLGLVAAMLAVGRFVYKETQRTAVSLAAMGFLGISTVLESAVTWYSAGQAVCAGAAVVLTLNLTRSWRVKGGQWRFGLMLISVIAAPAIWSGGHVAGPAAAAYLWVWGGKRARHAALVLMGLAASVVLLELVLIRHEARETAIIWEIHEGLLPRPIQAILHSTQAISETLVFANLGLDTITSPLQSVAIVIGLGVVWRWSKGTRRRISPLEAAGATIVIVSCLMVYILSWQPAVQQSEGSGLVPCHPPDRRGPVRGRMVDEPETGLKSRHIQSPDPQASIDFTLPDRPARPDATAPSPSIALGGGSSDERGRTQEGANS